MTGQRETTEWIEEYAYFVPLALNGISVGTYTREFGVTVNVHRSARVRRIEISGMGIAARESGTVAVVGEAIPQSWGADVQGSVGSLFPTAKVSVTSVGARYVLTAKDWGEANTPREMYDVIPTYPSSDGKGRQGWVYVVSRSIDDAEGKLSVVPDPRNQGMVQERQDEASIDGK